MENILIKCSDGKIRSSIIYSIDDFPYRDLGALPTVYKRAIKHKRKREYYNIPAAFDIETTTVRADRPWGFMYLWQFCLVDKVVFGRTWDEYLTFVKRLEEALDLGNGRKLVVYCHFLSFEFFWLKDFFHWDSVFARKRHAVIKAETATIEYRCSYFLSNMSLKKFCENSGALFYKRSGEEFNYRLMRYPHTPLRPKEKTYAYCDVRGLCECIAKKLEEDSISSIPLTSTGYVRREFKEVMLTKKNRDIFLRTQLTPYLYDFCKDCFRGGDTHANRNAIGELLTGIESDDIESSYPYVMLFEKFPMGEFKKLNPDEITKSEIDRFIEDYCCLFDIELFDFETWSFSPYLDTGHLIGRNAVEFDNGRAIRGKYARIRCTEIDYKIILNDYDIKSMKINELWICKKDFLPIEYRHMILKFAQGKTSLKEVPGKEYEYSKEKNKLNSSYGFMVTDICQDEWVFDNDIHDFPDMPEECDKEKTLSDYYSKRSNFLVYQWGVWVTAHARFRLRKLMWAIDGYGDTPKLYNYGKYCDTDSVKHERAPHITEWIEKENARIKSQWEDAISVDPEFKLVDKKGKLHYLGQWEYEGAYQEFITFGAKKYCTKKDGKIEVTVAGLNKEKASKIVAKKGIKDGFKLDTCFKAGESGRTTSWYNSEPVQKKTLDEHAYTWASNVAVLDTSYTLDLGKDFHRFLVKEFQKIGIDFDDLLEYNIDGNKK